MMSIAANFPTPDARQTARGARLGVAGNLVRASTPTWMSLNGVQRGCRVKRDRTTSAMPRVKVNVPSDANGLSVVQALLPPFAAGCGIQAADAARLETVVGRLVGFSIDNAYPDDEFGEIEVALEADEEVVHVVVHDWGLPLTSSGGDFGPLPGPLAAIADATSVGLVNLGAAGKRLIADVAVRSTSVSAGGRRHSDDSARKSPGAESSDAIEVRVATSQDAEAIAQLLFENYHLSYVHGDFYRPRYLMAALDSGTLHSTIAVHEGRVIGHHALMTAPDAASAETGAAVVHSAYRGLGVFGRMFERTLDEARARGLSSVYGDAVTLHPFSQRAELSHGYREAALQLGMVPAATTMRGFGADGPGRRTATLRSYRAFDEQPRQAALPEEYREQLESIYANLGLAFEDRPGSVAADGTPVTTAADEPRALGFLRIASWGREAHTELQQAVRHVLGLHVDVLYADIDLSAVDGSDDAVAGLNELGFFLAGLLVHGPSGHDHFRLQRLNSEAIELDAIVCDSPFAKALMQRVLDDKARVGG
jgi:N-acetylglutamate synthase-like GNAT family acetyltransferase/anti-sigma regulatory factor (Ser/Thr protein kinase)